MAETRATPQSTGIKQDILRQALQRFGTQGYEATSLQTIADDVGIRKQSLLYHFPSKEALHAAVIEEALDYWRQELPRVIASNPGYDRFDATVTATLRFFEDDPARARLALREMLDRPDALREGMREHLGPWISMLAEYIRLGQASGMIRAEVDAEAYIVQVFTMIISAAVVGPVMAGAVGDPDPARRTSELVRLAGEALFTTSARKA
jgi:AcrR family transcriptional regulator